MNLYKYENQLVDMLDSADSVDEEAIQEELAVVRKALRYAMHPQAQTQFVSASRRELDMIFNKK